MDTLIHVELASSNNNSFSHEIMEWAKKDLPKVVTFDFDNNSEPAIADYAIDLVKQSRAVAIVINVKDSQHMGSIRKFLDELNRNQSHIAYVILNGKHEMIRKMCTPFKEKFHEQLSLEAQKKLITPLFTHQFVA